MKRLLIVLTAVTLLTTCKEILHWSIRNRSLHKRDLSCCANSNRMMATTTADAIDFNK